MNRSMGVLRTVPREGGAPGALSAGGALPHTETCRRFTTDDARQLLDRLRSPLPNASRIGAGPVGGPITACARYCCAAIGLEEITARASLPDPRCPCARRAQHHREIVETN